MKEGEEGSPERLTVGGRRTAFGEEPVLWTPTAGVVG